MKPGKELLFLGVISIIFLAGCVGPPETPSGNGVIIKSFAPDLTEVEGNSPMTFLITVQNVGEKKATQVGAVLFGLSQEWKKADGTTPFNTETTGPWDLAPVDTSSGFSGEEAVGSFDVKTPPGKSSDITYDATVRVVYVYSTVSDSLARFVTSDYLRVNSEAQKGIMTSKSTSGPLLVTVKAQAPIISAGSTQARVQFEIQNIAGGRVFKNATVASDLDIIKTVKVSAPGIRTCRGVNAQGGVVTITDTIRLAGGKSSIITCDFDVSGIINFQDIPITLELGYNYFVESATQVTVHKAFQ
ncbi:MAG: hypothetical protein HYW24_01310 [Candidatus Aenigmarchaeota archaeon]|nr:hypothetical protein [Candidatus Aenigmarchaeota archaeon]